MIYRHKLKPVMGHWRAAGDRPSPAVWLLIGLLTLWGQGVRGQDRPDLARSRETAITRSIEQVAPAVAGINVVKLQRGPRGYSMLFDDPIWFSILPEIYRQVESLGSGLVISSDGYVVTNAHVVENAAEVVVTLSGGRQYQVEQIFTDPLSDIALLKINAQDLPGVKLGDSNDLMIGEWAIALGNPLGLFDVSKQPTATVGIISGLHMDFGHKAPGRVYQDMIQTDAAINPGNSGGPLVNATGEVIGINSFIFTGDEYSSGSIGIGFAIPINRVMEIVSDLKTKGRVNRDIRTGLVGQPVDRYFQTYLGLSERRGFLITAIDEGSAGEQAGLQIGDVILEVNGRPVNSKRDFINIIDEDLVKVGDVLELTIWRAGAEVMILLKLG
ncbi:MAG: trypsin-like peptidase domain-containing protein [Candidatus Marinimicrobia bacterium]|nr:trypsin-like peptidase domain-containing protein [Candidatus Neomarinimicrobiota bacterium]